MQNAACPPRAACDYPRLDCVQQDAPAARLNRAAADACNHSLGLIDRGSDAGVFVRIDGGIVAKIGEKSPEVHRDAKGKLSPQMIDKLKEASAATACRTHGSAAGHRLPFDLGRLIRHVADQGARWQDHSAGLGRPRADEAGMDVVGRVRGGIDEQPPLAR